ncbi:MAG: DNA mismatch repair endonuclease MutL, partial [Dehalococcoidia bacterium]|nr:DNA mismatch repair endonuclease MutL [Dehalococcoidia bacterium]
AVTAPLHPLSNLGWVESTQADETHKMYRNKIKMPIKILSPDVASKIAAGEVVERPASAVKELLDNSLDAGATQITVEVQGGGVRLIRVADNGAGIPPQEVDLAFERFATSKVTTADDLETISSLGFRGEALPSIAAVSDVTMVTRSQDELAGTFLNVKDGAVLQKAKRGCPQGTSVTVRNLFRSFPARLKFLKSTSTENGHISQLITQYSLAYPEVKFTLIIDGRTSFNSPGSGSLKEVLGIVYGVENAKSLLPVETGGEDLLLPRISGFVSPHSLTRATRSYISFYVNRRWVQSRMLTYALEEAYHGLLMTGRHPIAVINITMPPQELDVNVHPAKSEVRFRHDREVFVAVQKAVRDTLLAMAPAPMLDAVHRTPSTPAPSTERLFAPEAFSPATETRLSPPAAPEEVPLTQTLPILRVVGQVANTYIITEGPDGMYLIDQHAAHERILFEKISDQRQRRAVEIQGMLQPVPVELTVRQQEMLETQSETLSGYGFDIEHFGERTCLVRSVPAMLQGKNVGQSLTELLDYLAEGAKSGLEEGIAVSLACHSAVLAGQALSREEMADLVRQLEHTSQPKTCPHGRPTMIHLSATQLEKGFGRR